MERGKRNNKIDKTKNFFLTVINKLIDYIKAKVSKLQFMSESSIVMLVNVPKKKHRTDIRRETYYGFAIYARKNCGPDFMAAMNDGRISVSYGDTEVRYF